MNVTFKHQEKIVDARNLQDGQFAVALDRFEGEVFYRNVAGLHGLTEKRYWPSEYINSRSGRQTGEYIPEFKVRILESGDSITL